MKLNNIMTILTLISLVVFSIFIGRNIRETNRNIKATNEILKTEVVPGGMWLDPNGGRIGNPDPKSLNVLTGKFKGESNKILEVSEDKKTITIYQADTVIIKCNCTIIIKQ
jgi:hypothetical protein